MCNPAVMLAVKIIGAVASAASSYGQMRYTKESTEQQNTYALANYMATAEARSKDAQARINQLGVQSEQINRSATEEKMARSIEAMKARARAVVAAGESGVAGVTPDAIVGDIMGEAGRDIATIESNRRAKQQQTYYEQETAKRSGQTVGLPPYVQAPYTSMVGPIVESGLSIAGAGAEYYAKTKKSK